MSLILLGSGPIRLPVGTYEISDISGSDAISLMQSASKISAFTNLFGWDENLAEVDLIVDGTTRDIPVESILITFELSRGVTIGGTYTLERLIQELKFRCTKRIA